VIQHRRGGVATGLCRHGECVTAGLRQQGEEKEMTKDSAARIGHGGVPERRPGSISKFQAMPVDVVLSGALIA
jgi:hypothetical protein